MRRNLAQAAVCGHAAIGPDPRRGDLCATLAPQRWGRRWYVGGGHDLARGAHEHRATAPAGAAASLLAQQSLARRQSLVRAGAPAAAARGGASAALNGQSWGGGSKARAAGMAPPPPRPARPASSARRGKKLNPAALNAARTRSTGCKVAAAAAQASAER